MIDETRSTLVHRPSGTNFVDEQITIAIPLQQAARRLRRFFDSRGNADGSAANVPLGGSVAIIRLQRMENSLAPRYLLEWTHPSQHPLPPFAGELFVVGYDDYTSFALVLRGGYARSPDGPDRTFESAASGRVARATARYLLLQIRDFVEVDFGADQKRPLSGR